MLEGFHYKQIVDLSVPLKSLDTPIYPGYPQPLRTNFTTLRDDGYQSYVWTFVEHTSTHVDAPVHMVKRGEAVDKMPLSQYVGQGAVLDFSRKKARYAIKAKDIARALSASRARDFFGPGWIVLFFTGYTAKDRTQRWIEHPDLTKDACKFLIERKVKAVGFDAPSPDHAPFQAHKTLLPKGIVIFENLANLQKLLKKQFLFVGTPLKLVGGTASPCRPVALIM
ncbi:MAG: cyclase family protein [Thaumarchaeota archaeon]|nr:cyclase family protein [Nitrososphaerota archaeon]